MTDAPQLADRLHDGPMQTLTAARLQLDALASLGDSLPAAAVPLVRAALVAVEEAGTQVRAIMNELRAGDP